MQHCYRSKIILSTWRKLWWWWWGRREGRLVVCLLSVINCCVYSTVVLFYYWNLHTHTHTLRKARSQVFKTSFRKNKALQISARSLVWTVGRGKSRSTINKRFYFLKAPIHGASTALFSPQALLNLHCLFLFHLLLFLVLLSSPVTQFCFLPSPPPLPHPLPALPHFSPPSLYSSLSSSSSSFPVSRVCFRLPFSCKPKLWLNKHSASAFGRVSTLYLLKYMYRLTHIHTSKHQGRIYKQTYTNKCKMYTNI